MSNQALLLSYAQPLIVVDSADFDGTNDFMTRGADLSGSADSKTGIISFWVRNDTGDGAARLIFGAASGAVNDDIMNVFKLSTNLFRVEVRDTGGAIGVQLNSASTILAGAAWRHVLASWNLAATTASMYVDDVLDVGTSTIVNVTLNYTATDWTVGANPNGTSKLDGCLAELYFAPGQYLDLSVVENRRKFISVGKKPVYMGATGALPTGTAPLVYFHLADGEAAANFATNRGTGGNFTVTGALTTGSSSPSD